MKASRSIETPPARPLRWRLMIMTEQLLFIDLNIIELHPVISSWRISYEDIQDLAFDIKRNGVLEPVLVRPLNNGKYQLLAGNRRYHAAKEAGLEKVPARVLDVDDTKALEIALSENLQRRDLNPVELARALKSLVDQGYSKEEVAKMFGKSRPWVSNHIRILRLPDYVLEKIADGTLSIDHGIALLKLTWHPEKLKEVFEWIFDEQTSWYHNGIPSVQALRNKVEGVLQEIAREERIKSWGFEPYYICNNCRHIDDLPVTKEKYEKDGYKCSECGSIDLDIGELSDVWKKRIEKRSEDDDSDDNEEYKAPEDIVVEHNLDLNMFLNEILKMFSDSQVREFSIRRAGETIWELEIRFKDVNEKVSLPEFEASKKRLKIPWWWITDREDVHRKQLEDLVEMVRNASG